MVRARAIVAAAVCAGMCSGVTGARADQRGVDAPVRVTPVGDAVLTVDGARYRGSLEITRSSGGGLDVVDVVGADDYLRGVAEMPASWPRAALEAQAIVSRTQLANAIASGGKAVTVAADATGVPPYKGAGSESDEWSAALAATDGMIMQSGGRPAAVHSFATSIDEADTDAGAPLARWSVRILASDLRAALGAAGVPLPGSTEPTGIRVEGGDVVVVTARGEARMSTDAFARAVNTEAPERAPDRYPAPTDEQLEAGLTGGDGWGGPWPPPVRPEGDPPRLPLTLPSPHFDVALDGDTFVFTGRGWGGGTGMSKAAARRTADAGGGRDDILDSAFASLDRAHETLGGDVRVGIVRNADQVRLGADGGFFRIEGADSRAVAPAAFGEWTASPGGERAVSLQGPDGSDAALAVDGFTVPLRIVANRHLPVEFSLSRPADVTMVVEGPLTGQSRTERRRLGILDSGEATQVGLDNLAPGAYRVSVEAVVDDVTVTAGPFTVDVTPVRRGPSLLGVVGLVIVLTALLAGAVVARSRRRRDALL